MERIRLSGLGTYAPANLTCGACGTAIIKKGEAEMPIYYKDADGSSYCPGCRADAELEDSGLRAFTALDAKGHSIITVLSTLEDAGKAIAAELNKNDSRRAYLPKWEQGGRRVRTATGTELELGGCCPACSGEVKPANGMPGVEGVCTQCGGLKLSVNHTAEIATDWCGCEAAGSDFTELYYWRDEAPIRRGAHGWLCSTCHGITQTG